MRSGIFIATLLVSIGLAGCVTKKEHEALAKELEDTRTALTGKIAERDREVVELSEALDRERLALAEAEAEMARLHEARAVVEDELRAMENAKRGAEDELAEVLASRSALRASLDDMKRALAELNARRNKAEARVAEYRRLLERFKPLIDAGRLNVQIVDGRMVLVLPTDVLFPSASAQLSREGLDAIEAVGKVLSTIKDRKFQVEGHTDNDPIRTKDYKNNWELASARALNVVRQLLAVGVAPGNLSAASYGEHKPVTSNKSPEGKRRNRRIEIIVVPDLSELPGFEELREVGKEQAGLSGV